jgi:hypothetical protein
MWKGDVTKAHSLTWRKRKLSHIDEDSKLKKEEDKVKKAYIHKVRHVLCYK